MFQVARSGENHNNSSNNDDRDGAAKKDDSWGLENLTATELRVMYEDLMFPSQIQDHDPPRLDPTEVEAVLRRVEEEERSGNKNKRKRRDDEAGPSN